MIADALSARMQRQSVRQTNLNAGHQVSGRDCVYVHTMASLWAIMGVTSAVGSSPTTLTN